MESVKNPLLLIDAVRILKEQGLPAETRILMFGSGSLYKKVKERIIRYGLENTVSLEPVLLFEKMPGSTAGPIYIYSFGCRGVSNDNS